MTKVLPKDLTSYDFLKAFAVLLMVVDHIGYYFFPDEDWWRVAGRICVPIWFFLIGYARSRDIGPKMWIGSGVLIIGNIIAGMSVFPLSILPTMIALRFLIDPVMERTSKNLSHFWGMAVLLLLLAIPTAIVTEYGTMALIMAMYGYVLRHKEELTALRPQLDAFMIFCFVSFVVIQYIMFGFLGTQFTVLCIETAAVMTVLYFFKPVTYPELTRKTTAFSVHLIQFLGRRTLEIYVVHLMLFKGLAMIVHPDEFTFLHWQWLPF